MIERLDRKNQVAAQIQKPPTAEAIVEIHEMAARRIANPLGVNNAGESDEATAPHKADQSDVAGRATSPDDLVIKFNEGATTQNAQNEARRDIHEAGISVAEMQRDTEQERDRLKIDRRRGRIGAERQAVSESEVPAGEICPGIGHVRRLVILDEAGGDDSSRCEDEISSVESNDRRKQRNAEQPRRRHAACRAGRGDINRNLTAGTHPKTFQAGKKLFGLWRDP